MKGHSKKPSQLFCSGGDKRLNACVNFSPGNWDLYAVGYKKAADVLVQSVEKERMYNDILIYPIVFLYRQFIELRLKELITLSSDLLEKSSKKIDSHLIDILWKSCRLLLSEALEEIEDLDKIDPIMQAFYEIDPKSYKSRYPFDNKGNIYYFANDHINIQVLSEQMEIVENILGICSTMLHVALERKRDWEAEMRKEYE